jgi:hypothetical protein
MENRTIQSLLGENERLKKELAAKEELIRTQTAKVSELQEKLRKLQFQASPTSSPNESPVETPAQSQISIQRQSSSSTYRRLSYTNSDEGQDGNVREDSETKPITDKEKAIDKGFQTVQKIENRNPKPVIKIGTHYMRDSRWVHFYDPSEDDGKDECVKDHPLYEIAQRCASISTSEDEEHIYTALLNVDDQWKHYVGKAQNWMKRWTQHQCAIKSVMQLLQKEGSFQLLNKLQLCDIEMAIAIFESILHRRSAPAIVVYKMRSRLEKSVIRKHEQHFMNAFQDFEGTKDLNMINSVDKRDNPECPLHNGSCKEYLIQSIQKLQADHKT